MKRRDFLTNTMLFAAVSTILGKAAGLMNSAHAVEAAEGKLGYKKVSPQAANKKMCGTCKHYKAGAAGKGECILPAMQNAMKGKPVEVLEGAYCNMWAKKA